tara:strand:- start:1018 stop:2148 length:1131 start_codon:yes stop_codon:yes gene_type:complete
MKLFLKSESVYSGLRLRQILNDLKRRPEDAAKELNINLKNFKKILNGKKIINEKLVKKISSKYPIKISDLVNPYFDIGNDYKIMHASESLRTKRIIKRGGKNYYEYRDTVMEKYAPYRPEWIRQLCYVKNNNPKDKSLKWNRGHLLHQFTYFIGEVNFYYIDKKNKKRVAIMNTGDSMYIGPYVPHTFASRRLECKGYIVAVTYFDKISTEIQNELLNVGVKKSLGFLNSNNKIHKYNKVLITKYKNAKYKNFTKNNTSFRIKKLASTKLVPNAKSYEIAVTKNNRYNLSNSAHQYIYVLNGNKKILIGNKSFFVKSGDSIYIKPFTNFILYSKDLKILSVQIEGKISGEVKLQLSQIGKQNLKRIIYDNLQWYKS